LKIARKKIPCRGARHLEQCNSWGGVPEKRILRKKLEWGEEFFQGEKESKKKNA